MSSSTTRSQLLEALSAHFPPEVAEGQFQRARERSGLPDQPEYAPEELALLGRLMLELAHHTLQPSLPELAEIPGPAGH